MKKVFYLVVIFFVITLTFSSCLRESNTITLSDYISEEYIYNYFPYEKGQVLLFVNEDKSDSCTFLIVDKGQYSCFMNSICYYGSGSYGYNEINTFVCFEKTDSLSFRYSFNLWAVHHANNPTCTCFRTFDYFISELGNGCGLDGNSFGYSRDVLLEDIDSFFTPVVIVYDDENPTEKCVRIVNGTGITMFTDYYGNKWYFDSVLSK